MVDFTVLGSSSAWPEKERACSGYLLESGGTRLVLDLGFGTLPRLLELCHAEEVSAVFVTHAHADHCVDLFGLYRARTLPEPAFAALPVYALPEVLDRVGGLDGSEGPARMRQACDFHPLGPSETAEVGPFRVRTVALPHFVPNLGFRVEVEGFVIAYTGDTGPDPEITDLAQNADLFVCEATYQGTPPQGTDRFLLTAAEAGQYAHAAEVDQLMLTHIWPDDDRTVSYAEAAQEFKGKIVVADEGFGLTLD